MVMQHTGADGTRHSGPGGLVYCQLCDTDRPGAAPPEFHAVILAGPGDLANGHPSGQIMLRCGRCATEIPTYSSEILLSQLMQVAAHHTCPV